MYIKRYKGEKVKGRISKGGICVENVLKFDSYIKEQESECEWDSISSIFTTAIKRKGLTKEELQHISDKIIKDVRGNR
ncbi:MAG: hypothetical protein ACRCWM_02400 [Sarcina sp.]